MKKKILILTFLLVLAGIADLWTTSHFTPGREANPVAAWLWREHGFRSLIALKGLVIFLSVVPMFLLARWNRRLAASWMAGVTFSVLLWTLAAIYNWRLI